MRRVEWECEIERLSDRELRTPSWKRPLGDVASCRFKRKMSAFTDAALLCSSAVGFNLILQLPWPFVHSNLALRLWKPLFTLLANVLICLYFFKVKDTENDAEGRTQDVSTVKRWGYLKCSRKLIEHPDCKYSFPDRVGGWEHEFAFFLLTAQNPKVSKTTKFLQDGHKRWITGSFNSLFRFVFIISCDSFHLKSGLNMMVIMSIKITLAFLL